MQLRYLIYALSTSTLTCLYALRLAFHSTIICQLKNEKESFLDDKTLRQYTFQSVGFGLALGLLPLHFMHKLGTKQVTIIFTTIGIIASFLYPISHQFGFYTSFIVRVFQGFPLVLIYYLIARISAEWAPKNEIASAIALLTSVYQIAPGVASITSAEMCQFIGWEFTYYFLATICTISIISFYFLYSNNVMENRFLSVDEKMLITEGKRMEEKTDKTHFVPYEKLLKDPTVWTTWLSNFTFFSSLLLFLQYGPIYIHTVLGFSNRIANYSAGVAHVLCLVAKLLFAQLLDKSRIEMTRKLKSSWTIVEIVSILIITVAVLISNKYVQLISIILFIAVHGVAIVVIVKVQTLHTAEHNHILANGNTFCVVLCLFTQPLIVKHFVELNTFAEWSTIFVAHGAAMICTIILFVSFIDATPAKWTGNVLVPASADEEAKI